MTDSGAQDAVIELIDVSKHYGNLCALSSINLTVRRGQVTCILGDNGAGKSTLIKIIAGMHPHDSGTLRVQGKDVRFTSPRAALDCGIATVYQDLALIPLMSVWRNFFLGSELSTGFWPLRRLAIGEMRRMTAEALRNMGIELPDMDTPVGSLSGGEMQVVAIARAIHFGAQVLILDEPTAHLGVKQSGIVLKYIAAARDAGLSLIFISHNPHHAYLVGDHFCVLSLGSVEVDADRDELALDQLVQHMAGGAELQSLRHEIVR